MTPQWTEAPENPTELLTAARETVPSPQHWGYISFYVSDNPEESTNSALWFEDFSTLLQCLIFAENERFNLSKNAPKRAEVQKARALQWWGQLPPKVQARPSADDLLVLQSRFNAMPIKDGDMNVLWIGQYQDLLDGQSVFAQYLHTQMKDSKAKDLLSYLQAWTTH